MNATPVRGPNDGSSGDDDPRLAFVYQEALDWRDLTALLHCRNRGARGAALAASEPLSFDTSMPDQDDPSTNSCIAEWHDTRR